MNNLDIENAIDDGKAINFADGVNTDRKAIDAATADDADAIAGASTDRKRERTEAKKASLVRKRFSVASEVPPTKPRKAAPAPACQPERKSKKDQLIALLSKPNGVRISVIVEKLGWQAHTVRATLSGLRKNGFEIMTSKSVKTGETVYAIAAGKMEASNGADGAAA